MDGFFYIIIWFIGIFILFFLVSLYFSKRITKFTWVLFWIGVGIGICWELPMSIANELGICCGYFFPPATFNTHTPIQGPLVALIIAITHSFWDGGLFLLCTFFVYLFYLK